MALWKVRAAASNMAKALLIRTHPVWAKITPGFYYPYRFPGGRIYLNIRESQMMLLRALGRYEVARHKALETFLVKGAVFLDVGANKGDFSLFASRLVGESGRILAFEPAPENCRWIRRSVDRNGYQNIELYEMALSDENGHAELYLGEMSGWHSLVTQQSNKDKGSIRVGTRRLDDFLENIDFHRPIDGIKIDVEGADMHVLRGAHDTLLNNESVVVFLDVHPELGVDLNEVFQYLRNLGFTLFAEVYPFDKKIKDGERVTSLVARRT